MINGRMHELPWPAMLDEMHELGRNEARSCGVRQQEVRDAVQDTCEKIIRIGTAHLPACLVGKGRGAWLRIVVRNVVLCIRDTEQRWRRLSRPETAAGCAAALRWARHPSAGLEQLDLSRLWPEEVQVVVMVHLGLSFGQIAEMEGLAPDEVLRRALWGGLRGQEPAGSVPPALGREPGSLTGLRGAVRTRLVLRMVAHGWPASIIASECGTSVESLQRLLRRGPP